MNWKRSILFLSAIAFGGVVKASSFSFPKLKQVDLLSSTNSDVIEDHYIVVFKKGIKSDASTFQSHFTWLTGFITLANIKNNDNTSSSGNNNLLNTITHIYEHTLVGYAGRFQKEVLDKIRSSEDIAFIEKDSLVYASDIEKSSPWGLARISHRNSLGFGTYDKYIYEPNGGEGVTAYILDTGIYTEHDEFEGRATIGKSFPKNDTDQDGLGHGTHVAGTIGGKRYGVAKKVKLVAVKVLNSKGSGPTSDVIRGIDFTLSSHRIEESKAVREGKPFKGSVANMSLGGGLSKALNLAVEAAVEGGVFYAVAAGNENQDACQTSPASSEAVLTVGASTITDERAWFSNFGKCVDAFGPGKDVQSAWIGSNNAVNTISGTSMATPHVAGLAAYFLSLSDKPLTPKELKKLVISSSTPDILFDIPEDTPNLLIYNNPPSGIKFFY